MSNSDQHAKHFCVPKNNYPRIVVIGAGFAGVNFIRKYERKVTPFDH